MRAVVRTFFRAAGCLRLGALDVLRRYPHTVLQRGVLCGILCLRQFSEWSAFYTQACVQPRPQVSRCWSVAGLPPVMHPPFYGLGSASDDIACLFAARHPKSKGKVGDASQHRTPTPCTAFARARATWGPAGCLPLVPSTSWHCRWLRQALVGRLVVVGCVRARAAGLCPAYCHSNSIDRNKGFTRARAYSTVGDPSKLTRKLPAKDTT